MRKVFPLLLIPLLSGCGLLVQHSASQFKRSASGISLGESKENVVQTLAPSQAYLPAYAKRPSESFISGNDSYEILFFRSAHIVEKGPASDQQFTPFVFKNGRLISIGWTFVRSLSSPTKN